MAVCREGYAVEGNCEINTKSICTVVPRRIFILLNLHGHPTIEPTSFIERFVKRPSTRLESACQANKDFKTTLYSKNVSDRTPSYSRTQ